MLAACCEGVQYMAHSTVQRTAEALLIQNQNRGLDAWLIDRRGLGISAEAMSRELAIATGGIVSVSGQTIRRWLDNLDEEVA